MNRQYNRTNRMLRAALLELLDEKPYPKITVSDIVERADLSRSTFYVHFDTKDDLLCSFIEDILDEFFDILSMRNFETPDEAVDIEINVSLFRLWKESAEITRLVEATDIDLAMMRSLTKAWQRNYNEKIADKRPNTTPTLAVYLNRYLASSYFGILRYWIEEGMQRPPELMGRLLYALTGPPILNNAIQEVNQEFAMGSETQ
ncbi:MAG: TetR/AcrR family transcriptional regulator [Chloroflexi bacterium]|nr:MAG: TetR/AcrR family transcriptional regulator [Chloroflexota bacterium]MBL1194879.1 TetR/AcrR family transcriptional regulator [Chloroflexota bacterium]NOH12170.1 TetR/AcrR family transcriptional regulator [Chloroflexota bacterium]